MTPYFKHYFYYLPCDEILKYVASQPRIPSSASGLSMPQDSGAMGRIIASLLIHRVLSDSRTAAR